jgi:hypothetical protein
VPILYSMDTAWTLVRDIIREDLDFRHVRFTPKFGGHTGAYTGVMTSSDGRSVFIKWAGEQEPFGREALKFEVAAHQWIPATVAGKAVMVAHRQASEGLAAAFGVNENPSPQHWKPETIATTVNALMTAHSQLRATEAPITLPDVENRLLRVLGNNINPWYREATKFTDMAFSDQYYADICHTDIHKGNIMIDPETNETEIVDWAWVTRMPTSYDFVMLGIDAAIDGNNPWDIAKQANISKKEFKLALATYASTLYTLKPDEHKHARTRKKRQELVQAALRY